MERDNVCLYYLLSAPFLRRSSLHNIRDGILGHTETQQNIVRFSSSMIKAKTNRQRFGKGEMELITRTNWLYEIGPIDYWTGWTPLEQVKVNNYSDKEYEDLESDAEFAKVLIEKYTSWEGDGRWYVSGMPTSEYSNSLLMFAVKQSNNGSTFICTPFPLPWLDTLERMKVVIPDAFDKNSWIVTKDDDDRNDLETILGDQYLRYWRILEKG